MPDFSAEDLLRLERLQRDRLYELYPKLKQHLLFLDLEYCLNIRGTDANLVQDLICDVAEVLNCCYLALGCRDITIWLGNDRLWRGEFNSPEGIELGTTDKESPNMATATAERASTPTKQTQAKAAPAPKSKPLEEVARDVAAITGQSTEVAANLTIAAVPQTDWVYRGGQMILPASAALQSITLLRDRLNEAIDNFNGVEAAPLVEANGAVSADVTIEPVAEPAKPTAAKPAAKRKPAAKKVTTSRAGATKTVKNQAQKTGTAE